MSQPRTPQSPDNLERVRYFARQTLLPADLGQDAEYLIQKSRRHNRILHGWGIWSGLKVEAVPVKPDNKKDPATIIYDAFVQKVGQIPMSIDPKSSTWLAIAPGFALTPLGDEVYIPDWVFVDYSREIDGGLVTAPSSCRAMAASKITRTGEMYLVVDAQEDQARPVRASCSPCGDDPEKFEFTRVVDTLRFRLLPKKDVVAPYTSKLGDTTDPEVLRLRGSVVRDYLRLAVLKFEPELSIQTSDRVVCVQHPSCDEVTKDVQDRKVESQYKQPEQQQVQPEAATELKPTSESDGPEPPTTIESIWTRFWKWFY